MVPVKVYSCLTLNQYSVDTKHTHTQNSKRKYSMGHKKVPIPFTRNGISTVLCVAFPYSFRVYHFRTLRSTCERNVLEGVKRTMVGVERTTVYSRGLAKLFFFFFFSFFYIMIHYTMNAHDTQSKIHS